MSVSVSNEDFFLFVLMPFAKHFDDTYRLGIKAGAQSVPGLRVERLDEQMFDEGMLDRIYRQIDAADVIVADLSERNPNVFYELGYAHAKGKLTVLLTNNVDDLPFDLKHRKCIVYDSLHFLQAQLAQHLNWAVEQVKASRKTGLRLSLRGPDAWLDKDQHSATATVRFVLDVMNESDRAVEVTAVYVELTDWAVKQDSTVCRRRQLPGKPGLYESKLTGIVHLEPGGWDELRWSTSKVLGSTYKKEQVKDSYPIAGVIKVRIVTKQGTITSDFTVKTVADVVPF